MPLNICFVAIDDPLQIPLFVGALNKLSTMGSDACVSVVVNSEDKELLKAMNYNGRVSFFDKASFSSDVSCSEANILNSSANIKKQLSHSLGEEPFDIVLNLGFSQISSLVSSMIKSSSYQGSVYDEYSRTRIDDPWLDYFNSVSDDGSYNTFHCIDLVLSSFPNRSSAATKARLFDLNEQQLPQDGLQLKTKKNIFVDRSSSFMQDISEELSGRAIDSCKNYVFTSSEEQRYSEVDVVITDDVFFSMSSSVLGNKVVFISSNDAQALYQPYGEGNYVLRPKTSSSKICDDIISLLGFIFNHRDKALLITPNSDFMVSRLDQDGFLEYVPLLRKRIGPAELYSWIYRAVFKCTMGRTVRAGDPQRFLAFGEKYIDRVVDIDRQVEYLCEHIINKYNHDDVISVSSKFAEVMDHVIAVKEIAFEGQKKAKEFLNVVAVDSNNMDEIKKKRNELSEIDSRIYALINGDNCYAEPLIRSFVRDRDDAHVANLFPLAKKIMCLYEDLFSKLSFLEEIIKELWKRIN
jgi:hypothetical protein